MFVNCCESKVHWINAVTNASAVHAAGSHTLIDGLPQLIQQPEVLAALSHPSDAAESDALSKDSSSTQPPHVALVFGREYEGLAEEEIKQCSASCCITMGRLHESLSLSHAVCLVLGSLFEHRLALMPSGYRDNFRIPIAGVVTG
jgi:tRNA C32,U32 (ribose-2'-O)-methylase TrmJ